MSQNTIDNATMKRVERLAKKSNLTIDEFINKLLDEDEKYRQYIESSNQLEKD